MSAAHFVIWQDGRMLNGVYTRLPREKMRRGKSERERDCESFDKSADCLSLSLSLSLSHTHTHTHKHAHTQVREEHLELARDAGTERAKVEFVKVN